MVVDRVGPLKQHGKGRGGPGHGHGHGGSHREVGFDLQEGGVTVVTPQLQVVPEPLSGRNQRRKRAGRQIYSIFTVPVLNIEESPGEQKSVEIRPSMGPVVAAVKGAGN